MMFFKAKAIWFLNEWLKSLVRAFRVPLRGVLQLLTFCSEFSMFYVVIYGETTKLTPGASFPEALTLILEIM